MEKAPACLICGKELVYAQDASKMTCALCGKSMPSNACCMDGHFVCDACHMNGLSAACLRACRECDEKDPVAIMEMLMALPGVHMHGPEHHFLIACALLTAYAHVTGEDLSGLYARAIERGSNVPGGICGRWGNCGAAVGAGIFLSVLSDTTSLSVESWGQCNRLSGRCLQELGALGGPRCCKRNTLVSIRTTAAFLKEEMGIELPIRSEIRCAYSAKNDVCIRARCPFYAL